MNLIPAVIGTPSAPLADLSTLDGSSVANVTASQWGELHRLHGGHSHPFLLFVVSAGPPKSGRAVWVTIANGMVSVQARCRAVAGLLTSLEWYAFGPEIRIGHDDSTRDWTLAEPAHEMLRLSVASAVAAVAAWLEQGRPPLELIGRPWPADPRSPFDPVRIAEETASRKAQRAREVADRAELHAAQAAEVERRKRARMSDEERDRADLMERLIERERSAL